MRKLKGSRSLIVATIALAMVLAIGLQVVSALGAWTPLANAPDKVKEGGALVYDGSRYIYALRAKDSKDFWRYDTSTSTWDPPLAQTPDKVKEGGALVYDGSRYIYALRAKDSKDFWRYDTSTSTWDPPLAQTPDKVKWGGALAYDGSYVYALRANDSEDFWRYSATEEPDPSCGECDGKVTQLTLRYNGAAAANVQVIQKNGDVVFDEPVGAGGTFTFTGTDNGTLGTEITIKVNGVENTKIHTSCSQPIGPGMIFGDFEVVEGYSRNGGKLCSLCDIGDRVWHDEDGHGDQNADPIFGIPEGGLNSVEVYLYATQPITTHLLPPPGWLHKTTTISGTSRTPDGWPNGIYGFDMDSLGLGSGEYWVWVDERTLPGPGVGTQWHSSTSNPQKVNYTAGTNNFGIDFGYYQGPPQAVVDLALAKTLDPQDSYYPGQQVTFSITVTNEGSVDATGVKVEDFSWTTPTLTYVSADSGGQYYPLSGNVIWYVGNLPAGTSAVMHITFAITSTFSR